MDLTDLILCEQHSQPQRAQRSRLDGQRVDHQPAQQRACAGDLCAAVVMCERREKRYSDLKCQVSACTPMIASHATIRSVTTSVENITLMYSVRSVI